MVVWWVGEVANGKCGWRRRLLMDMWGHGVFVCFEWERTLLRSARQSKTLRGANVVAKVADIRHIVWSRRAAADDDDHEGDKCACDFY